MLRGSAWAGGPEGVRLGDHQSSMIKGRNMATIPDRLKAAAAKAGSENEVGALLREPGCDALDQDDAGLTALMWAA